MKKPRTKSFYVRIEAYERGRKRTVHNIRKPGDAWTSTRLAKAIQELLPDNGVRQQTEATAS